MSTTSPRRRSTSRRRTAAPTIRSRAELRSASSAAASATRTTSSGTRTASSTCRRTGPPPAAPPRPPRARFRPRARTASTKRRTATTPVRPCPASANVSATQHDFLFRVVDGGYYGHPNPQRCEWVLNGGNPTAGDRSGPGHASTRSARSPTATGAASPIDFGEQQVAERRHRVQEQHLRRRSPGQAARRPLQPGRRPHRPDARRALERHRRRPDRHHGPHRLQRPARPHRERRQRQPLRDRVRREHRSRCLRPTGGGADGAERRADARPAHLQRRLRRRRERGEDGHDPEHRQRSADDHRADPRRRERLAVPDHQPAFAARDGSRRRLGARCSWSSIPTIDRPEGRDPPDRHRTTPTRRTRR